MFDAISATHLAMGVDQLKLQSLSQNVANMNTPGYKKNLLEYNQFDEQLQTALTEQSPQLHTSQITTQGVLNQTRNLNNLALAGDGYFQVQNDQGIFYTRRGDFQINDQGQLSLPTGEVLIGNSGAIRVDDANFTIDAQGVLFIDNRRIDQLELAQFESSNQLHYLGNGLYQSEQSPSIVNSTTHVMQGFLEQSNVKSVDEMLEMVKISRHFEVSQRIMRTADNLLATAINKLGEGNV